MLRVGPGLLHSLFKLHNETLCMLLQTPVPGVLIRFTLLKKLVRDVQCCQHGDLDRVDTRGSFGNLPHANVDELRQLLEARHVPVRTQPEPLTEDLDSGADSHL